MGFLIAAIILAAILCLRVSVRIGVGEELSLIAGVGFIRIKIFPTKEKTLKLSDYRTDKFKKRLEREKRSEERKSKKDSKKSSSARDEKRGAKASSVKNDETEEKRDIPALISKLARVVGVFLKRFGKHLRIDLRRINIRIATGDAALTAILWGASIGAAQDLYALLVSSGTLKTTSQSEFTIVPDYLAEKPSVDIDLRFSFMLWQLFDMAIRAAVEYLKRDGDEV